MSLIIKPVKIGKGKDTRPVLGEELFATLKAVIFILARRNSGKSTVINHIIKECAGRHTHIIFFVATLYNDLIYQEILKRLDRKNISYEAHTSLKGDEDDENSLSEIVNDLIAKAKQEREESKKPHKEVEQKKTPIQGGGMIRPIPSTLQKKMFFQPAIHLLTVRPTPEQAGKGTEQSEPESKSPYQEPKLLFVIDDMTSQTRNKHVENLVKISRHFDSKVIISSQYPKDITPGTWENLDYLLIFAGFGEELLREIHERLAMRDFPFEQFVEYYRKATQDKYGFLYCDIRNDKFRIKFDRPL